LRPEFIGNCLLGDRKGIQPAKKLGDGLYILYSDVLTGALHVLKLQLSPPPSPLAPIKSRMEIFWYWPTKIQLENGR